DGRIISVGGGFVPGLKNTNLVQPKFSALTAVDRAASKLGLNSTRTPVVLGVKKNLARGTKLRHREISSDDIPARLHYVPLEGGGVTLAWNVIIHTPDGQHWYDASVNDGSGELVFKSDWVDN